MPNAPDPWTGLYFEDSAASGRHVTDKHVIVIQPILGRCHMQVCACKDATNEEILRVCNEENQAWTRTGWDIVFREHPAGLSWSEEVTLAPVQCEDDANRLHITVMC